MGLTAKYTEAEFTTQVIQLARLFGWRVAHFRAARVIGRDGKTSWRTPVQGDGAGFPDVLAVHPEKGLRFAAELKVGKRLPTQAQIDWLAWLEACGIATYLWSERDWPEIERVLRGEL